MQEKVASPFLGETAVELWNSSKISDFYLPGAPSSQKPTIRLNPQAQIVHSLNREEADNPHLRHPGDRGDCLSRL